MAVVSAAAPCAAPSSMHVRLVLLLAAVLLGCNLRRSAESFPPRLRAVHLNAVQPVRAPVVALASRSRSASASLPPREIFLQPSAVKIEGIGAVLSGLKPILMLANVTGARITMHDNFTGHGYNMTHYLQLHTPFPDSLRVPCNLTFNVRKFLVRVVEQCDSFDYSELEQLGIFQRCNSLSVSKYIAHPRMCLKHTQHLVTAFTKFNIQPDVPKEHVCVLRRGGDIEHLIRSGEGNKHAIDEQRTLPILSEAKKRGSKVVLVTETKYEHELHNLYQPDVLSNYDGLQTVVSLLERCRCTFVSSSSAFATAMMQITKPTYIVYTSSRPGFSFSNRWYYFEEFGRFALDVAGDRQSIVDKCAPIS